MRYLGLMIRIARTRGPSICSDLAKAIPELTLKIFPGDLRDPRADDARLPSMVGGLVVDQVSRRGPDYRRLAAKDVRKRSMVRA